MFCQKLNSYDESRREIIYTCLIVKMLISINSSIDIHIDIRDNNNVNSCFNIGVTFFGAYEKYVQHVDGESGKFPIRVTRDRNLPAS